MEWNGGERSGAEWRGSSFRRRRNETVELPKDWMGGDGIGRERNGKDGK